MPATPHPLPMDPGFAALIFDCDGVLVDSEAIAVAVEMAALADVGLTYERSEFIGRFLGAHDDAFHAALEADSRERRGAPLPPGFIEGMYAQRRAEIADRLQAIEGAARAVAAWPGLKAVASSSRTPFLKSKLERTGLWDAFAPHVYSADLVPRGKPFPDIFLHTAEALGVDRRGCLVIEDSVNGVLAGRAAGMTVWGFTGGGHCDEASAGPLLEAGADRVVCSWAEAEALFGAFKALALP